MAAQRPLSTPSPLRLKVCLVSAEYPPKIGGVGVASRRLVGYLVEDGHTVHVVTPVKATGATTVERSREGGATVHRLHRDPSRSEADFELRRLVRELDNEVDFDLFHGFFLTAVHPCILPARSSPGGRRRPVLASIRGSDALTLVYHPYTRGAILWSLRKATWVTSVNQAYLDRVKREVDLAGRSSVIRNAVRLPPNAPAWRLDDGNRGVVGTAGEFRRVKDVPLLVRGYGGVAADLRRRLTLVGYFSDPEEEEWSHVLVDELGLRDELRLTGPFRQEEVYRHLAALHVYVQPSAFEGLPNTLLEAAALGVPLVATAVGGMAEVITDGEDGLLVPHGEPRRLTAALTRILSDDALARRLSRGALDLAARLSPENEKEAWLSLYRQVLEREG